MKPGVSLRGVEDGDLPIFFEHQADPEAVRMAAFPARELQDFLAHWAKIRVGEDSVFLQTIVFEGQVAGNIACWRQGDLHKVGYVLGKAYWGKGIASAALGLLLEQVKVRPILAHVATHNIGSLRVLQKNGFVISAVDKLAEPDEDFVDEYILMLGGPASASEPG